MVADGTRDGSIPFKKGQSAAVPQWLSVMALRILLLLSCAVAAWCSNHEPHFQPGRTTIVHLFEWKWKDVAEECETFLAPRGFAGVQVSPPNENGIVWEPFWNKKIRHPWFERYQPVSYKIATRSGSEDEFRDMVNRCNNVGVRIYVDSVINHMTGQIGEGQGTGGSHYKPEDLLYEGVPYYAEHFNSNEQCPTGSGDIENYNDPQQVRNCKLSGLNDLNLGLEYVRNKIAGYFNHLIDIGVAGFRVDAAKHMWPHDLQAIYSKLKTLNESVFPGGKKPFIYQEVIDLGGEAIKAQEYVGMGRVTEFRYGKHLGDVIRKNNNQLLRYLRNFGEGWSFVSGSDALTFVDNHDNQRGHGAGGYGSILTFRQPRMYKIAVAFMLAWPYGLPRVMSSYHWPEHIENGKDINDWVGPPMDESGFTKDVVRNADLSCGNGWVCEHRWRQIYNMVQFRNVAGFEEVRDWHDNGFHQIAFGRGNRAFIAINNENFPMNLRLHTELPQGTYCDVISGNKDGNRCTGRTIEVSSTGHAQIFIDNNWEDPIVAIHVEATKPLIEKRRRARINSSLAQLKEIVAKPVANTQENRSNRLEKADILEMTVEYVKRIHGNVADHESCFKDGYRLCMREVQNFFQKNYRKQASKQFLNRSLQNHLQRVFQRTATGDRHHDPETSSRWDAPRKNYDFHSENSNYSTDDEMGDPFPSAESNAAKTQFGGSSPGDDASKGGLPSLLAGSGGKLHTIDTMWRPW